MSVTLYSEQENGNLKLLAEVEGIENPALAVDALLDESPRLATRDFVALIGEDGAGVGQLVRVTVDSDELIEQPKRPMTITGGSSNGTVEVEEDKPARKSRSTSSRRSSRGKASGSTRKPPAKKSTQRRSSTAKRGSTRKAAPKAAAGKKKGGSPFKRNAKSDD